MRIRPNTAKQPKAAPPPGVQAAPPPPVRRSKSKKWLLVVAAVFGLSGWWIWDQFLRTSGHAVVMMDEILVAAPLAGLIESMRVKEDGEYEAGTIAFTVVDRDSRDELETLQLHLHLIESQMVEKAMNLRLSRADRLYERDELIAERRARLGKALLERAQLSAEIARLSAELPSKEFDLARIEDLAKDGTASERELIAARADYEAMSNKVEGLIAAREAANARIVALQGAVERPVPEAPEIDVGVEPLRRQANLVRRRIEQLHAKLLQSQVRLTVPGKVTRILHHPGEFVQTGEPVLVVAQPGTLHVVAYFDQRDISKLRVNGVVRIESSYAPEMLGRIARLEPALKAGPESIVRFYAKGEPVYPVEIELDPTAMKHLVPGSVVRVFPSVESFSTVRRAWANPEESP